MKINVPILLNEPHDKQAQFIDSKAKRKIIRAGRRGGKTEGVAILAIEQFLEGKRILYATPTSDQLGRFWSSVTRALQNPIDSGYFRKNETEHIIELPKTEQRIRAKTAWNADTLRGDYADLLILDEFQLMNEDTWGVVGVPMLLDNNGDAVFIYTPPSLRTRSASKANDPQHAAKMFKRAALNTTGRWATFNFSSHDNPHISEEALVDITEDMTALAYRMEILAEDVDEAPGALWTREIIERNRVMKSPELHVVYVAVDPSVTSTGNEAGIITAGRRYDQLYVIADDTIQGSPKEWAESAIIAYYKYKANAIVVETNNGGEMIALTIHSIDGEVPVIEVTASRGKQTRAEPISAIYEKDRAHHVGSFPALEDEMCLWLPGDESPNRMDALVWAASKLMLHYSGKLPEQPAHQSLWAEYGIEQTEQDSGSKWRRY